MSFYDLLYAAGPTTRKLLELLPRRTTGDILQFLRLKIKVTKLTEDIKFNKQCLRNKVIPNYVCLKIHAKSNLVQRIKNLGARIWIKDEISNKFFQKVKLNQMLYVAHLNVSKTLTPIQFEYISRLIDQYIYKTSLEIRTRHKKKIDRLVELQRPYRNYRTNNIISPFNFFERIKNLTDIQFTTAEIDLLSKGLKFNLKPNIYDSTIKNLIASTKVAIDMAKLSVREQNELTTKVAKLIEIEVRNRKYFSNATKIEQNTLKEINHKLRTNNALTVKADKGNTLVIMKRENYIEKVQDFFKNNNITPLLYNPTNRFSAKVKLTLKRCKSIFSDQQIKSCIVMNPHTPTLRAQPKIHKETVPIRPIVNCIDSPTYILSKKLNKLLNKLYTYTNKYTIKNSRILAHKIKDIKIPQNGKFVSFDITNLYTNIPVTETIELIKRNLLTYGKVSNIETLEIIELLELTLSQNYFEFENQIYQQLDGVAMGNCIAGTIADIFINHLEEKFFNSNCPSLNKIVYYHRYVDDTLLLIEGNDNDIQQIHQHLNNLHHKIQFTKETEQNNSINFLDLTIKNDNGTHKFEIYRKPTTTDTIINNNSCHPNSHKSAFFKSMVNRIVNLPLDTTAIQKEIDTLQYIAQQNAYNPAIVKKLYNTSTQSKPQHINTEITLARENKNPRKLAYVTIPYIGNISNELNKLFRNTNIKLAFRTNNTLKLKLESEKTKTSTYSNAGVYKISCEECDKFYIGQTGRNFAIRFKEHTRNCESNQSTFFAHLRNEKHKTENIDNAMRILHRVSKGPIMNILEEIEIYTHTNTFPDKILNEQTELKHKYYLENFIDFIKRN